MVNQEVQDAINEQIKHEFYAAYQYLGMMAFFESRSLSGFGHWMRLQAAEEASHAMKLVDFLLDRGGSVELGAIGKPEIDFASPLEVMKAALAHEQRVTRSINELYALAVKHADYPAQVLMQWFVAEQVEEEKNASEIVDQLELAGGSASALLVIDGRLAAREADDGEVPEA
ncbi:MAG: ferritin [Gemmatimonadota bacterium]|nr:ferritin [Gemmatimonadota bacterium]